MAQQFRALVGLVEDLGLILSTHMVTQTIHKSSFRNLTSGICRHQAHMWFTDIHAGKILIHILKRNPSVFPVGSH